MVAARVRRSRSLRLLVVLFMLPVALFGTPSVASAAASGILDFGLDGGDCRLGYAQNAAGLILSTSSRCDGHAPDYTPGFCQAYEGACGSYGLVAKDSNGSTCSSVGLSAIDPPGGNGFTHVSAIITGGFLVLDLDACQPVELCLSYYLDQPGLNNLDTVACVPVDLQPVEDPDRGCEAGTVTPPVGGLDMRPYEPPAGWKADHLEVVGSATNTSDSLGYWTVYGVIEREGTYADFGKVVNQNHRAWWPLGVVHRTVPVAPGSSSGDIMAEGGGGGRGDNLEAPRNSFLGAGVFWSPTDSVDGLLFAEVEAGRVGVTSPERCSWYWGQKIAKPYGGRPGEEDPVGPVVEDDPDPVVDPPVVDPPPDPPVPEDEPGFWGAVLAALAALIRGVASLASAIANLAKSIVEGIRNGLKALFIPETSMRSHVNDVKSAYSDSFPFNFGDSLSTMGVGTEGSERALAAPGGGGGCPSWTVHVGSEEWSAVCDSSFTQAIRSARPFLAAGLITAAFWPLVRGMFYASIPLIKPVPTGGGR